MQTPHPLQSDGSDSTVFLICPPFMNSMSVIALYGHGSTQ
jgi:hypothetical protein